MTYLRLEKCAGPACPRCGCTDCDILQRPPEPSVSQQNYAFVDPTKAAAWARSSWWQSGKARCNHCRNVFSFQEMPAPLPAEAVDQVIDQVPDAPPRKVTICPNCGADEFIATTTQRGVQYRKCRACKHKGKTPLRT